MRNKSLRGVAILEFSFIMLVLVPLLLGTAVVGVNMVRSLQTIQLGRDAGHMYARGVDFSQAGNKTILASIGAGTGLSTTSGSGNAVVMLSSLLYVDKAICLSDGLAVDAGGNPIGCTNLGKWVFKQRLVIGKSSVHASNFGSPVVGGSTGVTIDATTGAISLDDQVKKTGDRATFSGVLPYSSVAGVVSGLPSGQVIYIAEAAAQGFNMAPILPSALHYSFNMF
jgi:hypothetical protein